MKLKLFAILLLISNSLFSQNFHDTQGKLDVSGSGQASYTIPIAMPPSLKDVGPIINLTYSSGQFGGIAGQGWGINSISYISRMATRKDVDGFVDGVDFGSNDKLALDGQRLILKSGTYWANGSTYQTEVQSNTRIQLLGTGASQYFIVTAPDGSRSWYGNYGGMNATDLTAFYIVRFEDTDGNYITYHYTKPFNASLCISEIKFSANTNGLAPINSILFNYKLAKRTETAFIKGVKHEKKALLDFIEVKTNNSLFRKYQLTHGVDLQLGYEKVIQVQEFNGALEPANPIVFEYENTTTQIEGSEREITYYNDLNLGGITLSGDFDGDGRLDFIDYTHLFTKKFSDVENLPIPLPETIKIRHKKFVGTYVHNNKLKQQQAIIVPIESPDAVNLQYFSLNTAGTGFDLEHSKQLAISNRSNCFVLCEGPVDPMWGPCRSVIMNQNNKYIEGDFNGDGISEVLIFRYVENVSYGADLENSSQECKHISTLIDEVSHQTLLVNLDESAPTSANSSGVVDIPNLSLGRNMDRAYTGDYNGDGKTDLLVITNGGGYKIYTFNQLLQAPWVTVEVIGQGTIDVYTRSKQLLFGDYNGDGKTDIMLPDSNGGRHHTQWHIYYSNPNPAGGSFFIKESHNIVEYWPNSGGYYETQTHFNSYYAMDTNGDGKSDLVRIWIKKYKPEWTINDNDTNWRIETYANNIGNVAVTGNKFTPDYVSPCNDQYGYTICDHPSGSPELPVPIVASFRDMGLDKEILMVRNHRNKITYVDFTKDVSKDILLKKITSSGGNIVDEVTYSPMEPGTSQGNLSNFYSSNNTVTYPNVEINRLQTNNLVSQLKNTVEGTIKFQDFKYNGLVINLHGLGQIGFNKTARSTWYQDSGSKKIWSVTEINPLWRGATKRSYTQLIESGNNFSFIANGDPIGIINSTVNEFQNSTTNSVFSIYRNRETVKDFLTNVITKTDYSYDPTYLLPTVTRTENFLGTVSQGISTSTNVFENNPGGAGSSYYIGRPLSSKNVTAAYGSTSETSQEYFYTAGKLSKTKKKGNTAESKYLVEEFEYGNYGNLKKKTISSEGYARSIAPRSTEYTYDPTGRYVKTTKDIEGLVTTNNSYHPMYGLVLSATDPFGLTIATEYDNWGKIKKATDYLGNNTITTYAKSGNEYVITKTGDDGSSSIQKSDALGRIKTTGVKNIDNTWSYKNVEYDFLGREYRKSEPYSSGTPSLWNTTLFDDYNRIIQSTASTGLVTNINYNGLTVTANDGTKVTSSTKNANGHVITATDNGGSISYKYYADGNLKESDFEGNRITMNYDEWGRKITLTDPSAGTYSYTYYATGEAFEETTPKGKTTYILDGAGKLIEKTIVGDLTNSKSTYVYDPVTKLLTSSRFTDLIDGYFTDYSYGYDNYKRLNFSAESKFTAYYQRATFFDSFGRPESELYSATNTADFKGSSKWTQNTYKNGYHWQILDKDTQQVLWETATTNERGQLVEGIFGNGIKVSNSYDQYGFATQARHWGKQTELAPGRPIIVERDYMKLQYNFDPIRGNLNSRSNSLFNWNETFSYDSLDRLTHYTNAQGIQEEQAYDNKGRITENSVGTYNYSATKTYQNTSIDVNAQSEAYYANRLGIFNDGFETQGGWTTYWNPGASYDNTFVHTGSQSIKLHSDSAEEKMLFSEINIPIDNPVATEYTYSAWYYSDGPQAEMFMYMRDEGEVGYNIDFDGVRSNETGVWKLISNTVLVPAHVKYLSVRIDNNGGVGNVWFDNVHIRKTNSPIPQESQLNITYNAFKSPVSIEETGVDKIDFTYNDGNDRSTMYYGGLQSDKFQRQYRKDYSADGTMEIKYNTVTGETEFITYIGGNAYTAPLVSKSDGTTAEYMYLHRDYQGAILAITDQNRTVVEKRLFDAWGNTVKIQDANGNNLSSFVVLDRGYTGHEHLQSVGLIHMNGRLYDAKLHRFLQPDNFVQEPYNTQNYNRYGYVLNNPLKYTDVTGELWGMGELASAVVIGAIIAATTYTMTALLTTAPFTAGGLIKATFIGAASSTVTFGIGSASAGITNFAQRVVFQTLAHGSFQGMMSGIQGGNFWTGFASGALSSIAATAFGGSSYKNNDGSFTRDFRGLNASMGGGDIGTLAFGTVMGGAGATLTGGNFWQGAATGLTVSLLNHAAHSEQQKQLQKQKASFEDGIRKVLSSAEIGEEITSSDLVSKYGVPKQAANLINSFTKTSATSIKVDWSSGFSMIAAKTASDAVFKDGNLNIEFLKNGSLRLSGNAIGIDYKGKVYNTLLLEGNYAQIPNENNYRWKIGL